jgi:hypothetical protein
MERELVVGAPGTATSSVYYPKAMNALVGTKFKIVSGYTGGNVVNLAMERGEVGGRGSNSWASWKSTKPHWLAEKKIFILVQIALKRHPELAGILTAIELAKTEEGKAVMTFPADVPISRAYVTAAARAEGARAGAAPRLRRHHEGPAIHRRGGEAYMDMSLSTGEEAVKQQSWVANTPAAILAWAKAIIEEQAADTAGYSSGFMCQSWLGGGPQPAIPRFARVHTFGRCGWSSCHGRGSKKDFSKS